MPCRRKKEVQQILYWYFHDYREIFDERSVRRLVNPAEDFEKEIVMQADLSDLRYLYRYGAYIGDNERQIAAYLNTLPEATSRRWRTHTRKATGSVLRRRARICPKDDRAGTVSDRLRAHGACGSAQS